MTFELSNYKNVDNVVLSIIDEFYRLRDSGNNDAAYDYISNYDCIHNVFQKIADENNLKYLDFNLVNASEHILTNNNFRDDAHLNDSGVKIVDKYMIDHGYLN